MPRCDHITFRVASLERTLAFYTHLLPGSVVSRREHSDRWRSEIATLRPRGHEDFALVFIEPRRVRWILWLLHRCVPRQARSHEHVGFACSSLAEIQERARIAAELGARVTNPLQEFEQKGGWLLEVLDPDRNAIEWTFELAHD